MSDKRPTDREKFTTLVDLLIKSARDAEIDKLSGYASPQLRQQGEQVLKDARQRLLTEIGVYP